MKRNDNLYAFIIGALVSGIIVFITMVSNKPKVDLPEEYMLITEDTPIKGYYKNDTLHIYFDNKY